MGSSTQERLTQFSIMMDNCKRPISEVSSRAGDIPVSPLFVDSKSELDQRPYERHSPCPVTPAKYSADNAEIECRRRDVKKERNRESAKKSRLLAKEKWRMLEITVDRKMALLGRMREARVKADAALGNINSRLGGSDCGDGQSQDGSGDIQTSQTSPPPNTRALAQWNPEAYGGQNSLRDGDGNWFIEKAQNLLYRRLLSPRGELGSCAQTLGKLLAVVAVDKEFIVARVLFDAGDAGSHYSQHSSFIDSIHSKDHSQVKSLFSSLLSSESRVHDQGMFIFAYRRTAAGVETWMKGVVEPVLNNAKEIEGVIIAEFLEH